MKLATGILILGMGLGTAVAQNPSILDNTKAKLTAVQQQKTADTNAALAASQGPSASPQAMMIAGAALLVIAVVILIRGILTRNAVQMAVTNKRVIAKVGVVTRRTVDLLLSRVESVGVEESVLGRMLGYGTVVLRGTGGTPESFTKIARPLEFRTQVQQQIDGMQMKG